MNNVNLIKLSLSIFLLISLIFQITAQICPPGQECNPEPSNFKADEPPPAPPPIIRDIYEFVMNLVIFIGTSIILAISIIALGKYSIKNKDNEKKRVLSLISLTLLFLDSIFFLMAWISCFAYPSHLEICAGETGFATFYIFLPFAILAIVPWIV